MSKWQIESVLFTNIAKMYDVYFEWIESHFYADTKMRLIHWLDGMLWLDHHFWSEILTQEWIRKLHTTKWEKTNKQRTTTTSSLSRFMMCDSLFVPHNLKINEQKNTTLICIIAAEDFVVILRSSSDRTQNWAHSMLSRTPKKTTHCCWWHSFCYDFNNTGSFIMKLTQFPRSFLPLSLSWIIISQHESINGGAAQNSLENFTL